MNYWALSQKLKNSQYLEKCIQNLKEDLNILFKSYQQLRNQNRSLNKKLLLQAPKQCSECLQNSPALKIMKEKHKQNQKPSQLKMQQRQFIADQPILTNNLNRQKNDLYLEDRLLKNASNQQAEVDCRQQNSSDCKQQNSSLQVNSKVKSTQGLKINDQTTVKQNLPHQKVDLLQKQIAKLVKQNLELKNTIIYYQTRLQFVGQYIKKIDEQKKKVKK